MNDKSNGPIFEAGPGWGAKIKIWLKKYFFKIILPIVVIILAGYGIANREKTPVSSEFNPQETQITDNNDNNAIIIPVGKGDGKILVARKAVAKYFELNPDASATSGQKLYLETVLSQNGPAKLTIGEQVTFYQGDIQAELENSKHLTQSQTQKWEAYAREAGIK